MIMTPRGELVCIASDATVEEALSLMGRSFDQLPVTDGGAVDGLVFRDSLTGAEAASPVKALMTPISQLQTVRVDDTLAAVSLHLADTPCVLVRDPGDGSVAGLVHYSDLNKHAARSNGYLWISALEMGLALLIHRACPDFEEWLGVLDERRQVIILGRSEYGRRMGIELDPVEGAELSDLLKAVRSIPRLLELFGYTKSQFDKKTGHLVKLRNAVMHPVRSAIHSHDDVKRMSRLRSDLTDLLDATYRILDSGL
jgi:CBS domain-containing protein